MSRPQGLATPAISLSPLSEDLDMNLEIRQHSRSNGFLPAEIQVQVWKYAI